MTQPTPNSTGIPVHSQVASMEIHLLWTAAIFVSHPSKVGKMCAHPLVLLLAQNTEDCNPDVIYQKVMCHNLYGHILHFLMGKIIFISLLDYIMGIEWNNEQKSPQNSTL